MDTQASAGERFEAAGSPASYASRLLLPLQGSCHSPFWVGLSMGGSIPQNGGCSLCLRSKPPRGETPLAWGLSCSRWGSEGLGLAWMQLRGPREEGIKGSRVGPAFISRLQRGANKLCPRARRRQQQLPPRGPRLLSPLLLLLLPGKPAAPQSQGHPRGALTPGCAGGKGRLCQAEGRKALGPSHLYVFPLWARLGAGGLHARAR